MKKNILIITLLAAIAVSCNKPQRPAQLVLKFIETTDVHGYLFPYDFSSQHDLNYSLAHVSTLLDSIRLANKHVVLLDNGDILQGQPLMYYSNFVDTANQHAVSAFMNAMRYDAASVGNHDIEAGHPVYDRLVNEFKFPWLAANAINTTTGKPYFKPYHIIVKEGVRIAIMGLITPAIPKWLPEHLYSGMEFEGMVTSAKKWIKHLQAHEKPDFIVGLFHAGNDHTYGGDSAENPKNENASMMVAEQVPGFDLIFTGHDHTEMTQQVTNQAGGTVLVMNAGSRGKNVAVASVKLTLNTQTNEYEKAVTGTLISTKYADANKVLTDSMNAYYEGTNAFLSEPVAALTVGLNSAESHFGNSLFVDFINQAQMQILEADISFAAPLSYNSTLEPGMLYTRGMFDLYRFENLLYVMQLLGNEIDKYLEYTVGEWFGQMSGPKDNLLNYMVDSEGKTTTRTKMAFYNFDEALGIDYTVDLTKPTGQRVTIHGFSNGNAFTENALYRVAINSYRGNGGGGHLTIGCEIPEEELVGRILESTPKSIRFHMMEWMKAEGKVTPIKQENRKYVPEKWYKAAKKREYKAKFE